MTKQRSFKRRVRDRMNKTQESYTAARRQLLDKMTDDEPTDETSPNPTPDAGDDANSREVQQVWSGVSARIVQQRTGRDWDEWFALLDAREATTHKHPEVAGWLVTEHGVDGWWAQSITVGYEQARGLRVVGQRMDGSFSATASKTIAVPVQRIFAAWTDEALREQWLPGGRLTIRTARDAKSLTADWDDGATRLTVGFTAQGDAKGHVALEHQRLPDGGQAGEMKVHWRERVSALKALLEGDGASVRAGGGRGMLRE